MRALWVDASCMAWSSFLTAWWRFGTHGGLGRFWFNWLFEMGIIIEAALRWASLWWQFSATIWWYSTSFLEFLRSIYIYIYICRYYVKVMRMNYVDIFVWLACYVSFYYIKPWQTKCEIAAIMPPISSQVTQILLLFF